MSHIPEIPFNYLEALLFGAVAAVSAVGVARRIIKQDFGKKKCVFCGGEIPADEYEHHLEICGLKMLAKRSP